MKTKCPYCHMEFNSPSIYNSVRNKGGLIGFEPGGHGYQQCPFCGRVSAFQTRLERGWEKIIITVALPDKQRPWGIYDEE